MTTNKKIIISLASLCSVLVIALVAVVAVFAATVTNVTSQVTVSYTAYEVAMTVYANVIENNGDDTTAMTTDGTSTGPATVTFYGTEDENSSAATGILQTVKDAELSKASKYVVYEFCFQNDSDTVTYWVYSNTDYPSIVESISGSYEVKYAMSQTKITDYQGDIGDYSLGDHIAVGARNTVYIYCMVTISNFVDDSSVTIDFSWGMKRPTTAESSSGTVTK